MYGGLSPHLVSLLVHTKSNDRFTYLGNSSVWSPPPPLCSACTKRSYAYWARNPKFPIASLVLPACSSRNCVIHLMSLCTILCGVVSSCFYSLDTLEGLESVHFYLIFFFLRCTLLLLLLLLPTIHHIGNRIGGSHIFSSHLVFFYVFLGVPLFGWLEGKQKRDFVAVDIDRQIPRLDTYLITDVV
jgi:hypothetical protein